MKINHLIFFILITQKLFGQQNILGKYCTVDAPVSYCFTFNKDRTFEYLCSSSYGEIVGSGNFIYYRDSIQLNFLAADTFKEYFVEKHLVSIFDSNKNSVFFYFEVLDNRTGLPVENVTVSHSQSKYKKVFRRTDKAGQAVLYLPNNSVPIKIEVNKYKYLPYEMEIVPDQNKVITIYFDTRLKEYIGNYTAMIDILNKNEKLMKLRLRFNAQDIVVNKIE